MNKKLFLGMFAAATMLFVTSCQNDELDLGQSGKESVVSFTLEQPGIATRAYSDGLTAKTLTYAVYEAGSKTPLIVSDDNDENQVIFSNKTATVNLRLVTGKSYDILFWADAENAPYTFNENAQTITVADNLTSQDENRDAFFAVEKSLLVDGAINKTITLYRPFAQLNIGTTDATESSAAAFTPTQSEVKVKTVYKTLNLFDGKVTDPIEGGQTYSVANIPGSEEEFPVDGVKYLSMNYLLVSNEKEVVDVEFTVTDGSHSIEREYASVPVQRNYRTNIYGKILTDPADFNIAINPDYITPDNGVVIWDGKTVSKPAETATEWTVATAAEWAYLAKNGANSKVIKLASNIDFGGYKVNPIYSIGGFDGQGYIMSNLELLTYGDYSAGLFQTPFINVSVENVTVKNVKAVNNTENGYVGTIFGDVQNGTTVTLNGVHVKNADLCGVKCVAGLVGFVASGVTLNIDDCSVDGGYFHNYPVAEESGFVAGLVGRPVGSVNVTNYNVTNTTIDAYYAPERKEESIQPVVGNNTTLTAGSDVTVIKKSLENAVYPANAEELQTATINDKAVVVLPEGTFIIPSSVIGKTATFVGSGNNTTINIPKGQGLSGSTLNFENVKVAVAADASYTGFQHIAGATYKYSTIEGQVFLYGSSTFENCTFNNSGNNYNVWTYGSDATFTGCTFNCDGKAVLVYNEGEVHDTVTFTGCTFNDNGDGTVSGKAAIEFGESAYGNKAYHTAVITDCEVNGFDINSEGESTGSTLWGNKNSLPTDQLSVTVNGKKVH